MGFHYTPSHPVTQFFDSPARAMLVVSRTVLLVALAACTPAQVPLGKTITEAMAIGGVVGLVGVGLGAHATATDLTPLGEGFAAISALGIIGWAILDLQFDTGPAPETIAQRNTRWAKILTQRASGAARENRERAKNCARVKRLEVRVRAYDPEIHDFVLMRDAEIVRCLQEP